MKIIKHKTLTLGKDVILEAFLKYLDDSFTNTMERAKREKRIVHNPYYWEKGEFVSLDYIDKYGNIIYTHTQPGVPVEHENYKIQVAIHYEDYKPYHDRWVLQLERDKKLEELV
jgi:hypothetical protein